MGREPLTYTQGRQQILPAIEQALKGMRDGDTKKVTLKPEEGYGPFDPKAQLEVPLEDIPGPARTVGAQLMARGRGGDERPVRVLEVKDKTIVLDLNHPLAGKTLVFDLKVLKVDPPP
jgi:FKBP-type peptidyl-prolyl cis-trans isomerase SlyD